MLASFELLKNSWNLYRTHFWYLVGYSAWILLPGAGFFLLRFAPVHGLADISVMLLLVLQTFLWLWIFIAITRSVVNLTQGKTPEASSLSKESLIRIPKLLSTIILQILVVLGGLFLFVIPGILFVIWYGFAQVISVMEDKRPLEALAMSRSLVQGRFFSVAWRAVCGPLFIAVVYSVLLALVIGLVGSISDVKFVEIFSEDSPAWVVLMENLGDIFVMPLFILYTVLLYQNLKEQPVTPKIEKSCDVG
jgi:hypothetical protein